MKNWIGFLIVILAFILIGWLLLRGGQPKAANQTAAVAGDIAAPTSGGTTAPTTSEKPSTAGQAGSGIVQDNMKIETTKQGSGPAITTGQTAVVDYVGKLEDGTVFDASAKHGSTFSFPLGAGQVIKGWDEGVVGMKVGETRVLTIPPELAYGPQGIPGVIPPNATLIFEVTLKGIK